MNTLRFSVFELDRESGELTRSGRRVALAHQSFVVLWLLTSRAGQVVTREDLRQALWSDGTHVDFDRGLNFCIASVRRALGDDARSPRFIETVPKRGYRFIADVREVGRRSEPILPKETRPMPKAGWLWAAAVLLALQGPAFTRAHTRATAAPAALAAFERGDYAEALRHDERFAEAHYALARHYLNLGEKREVPQRRALEIARAAAGRAIALEEAPESRSLLGSLKLIVDWDFDGARRDLARALDQAPAWDLGLSAYADVLSAAGDDDGALAAVRRAEAMSPGCTLFARQAAELLYRARAYDAALGKIDRALELGAPHEMDARQWQIELHDLAFRIHTVQRNWTRAQEDVLTLAALYGSTPERVRTFAALPAAAAVEEFLAASAELTRPPALRGAASTSRMAILNALAGRADEALAWLERAAAERDADFLFTLRDPALDLLRTSPRYHELLSQLTPVN